MSRDRVHPITAPNISEDPFITTDIRGTYIYHSFPRNYPRNGFLDGQVARVYDFQGRYAVTRNLQIFVNKLGVADIHLPQSEDHGITDLGLGFKYAILTDWETHQHVSLGASFEFGISDEAMDSAEWLYWEAKQSKGKGKGIKASPMTMYRALQPAFEEGNLQRLLPTRYYSLRVL